MTQGKKRLPLDSLDGKNLGVIRETPKKSPGKSKALIVNQQVGETFLKKKGKYKTRGGTGELSSPLGKTGKC